jgi:hypothetical protein
MGTSIDDALALALLYGFDGKNEARVVAVSVSNSNLKAAVFCEVVGRFYAGTVSGAFGGFGRTLPVGLAVGGRPAEDTPMLTAPLARTNADGKPVYMHGIQDLNDTAETRALIRNALTAQYDQNAIVVLSGPATNLAAVLDLPGVKELIARKVRYLSIAGGSFEKADVREARKLLAEWPTPIVGAGPELGEALLYPAASIEKDFAWSPAHPVVDAYRAYRPMPYDAPTSAMAAVLYAVRPKEGYFRVSDPGVLTVEDDGRTRFTASGEGKHRYLSLDPAQQERIVKVYTEVASAKPAPRVPRFRQQQQQQQQAAPPKPLALPILVLCAAGLCWGADGGFEKAVQPVLTKTCAPCHNEQLASGGLNLGPFGRSASITEYREGWEKILRKLRSGEMPPPGVPRPAAPQIDALVRFVRGEFEKADRNVKPDPGRVTARRLNRNEYANTIRDLLGVEFRADQDFPADDSGDGFDTIGEVLTVSPVLMEKYMTAAERIAARAIGADPLPAKPLEAEYHAKYRTIRRPGPSTIEATHRIEWDGEYLIRFGMPGERAADAKPVTLAFWMDGKLLHSMPVETKPSGLVYFSPFSAAEMRLYLPEGDHTFRAAFLDDEFVKTLSPKEVYNNKKNKFLDSITFVGPFPAKVEKPSRKRILVCDPAAGAGCVEKILATLARRAYRRPVSPEEVAALAKFAGLAKTEGLTSEQGIQLAIQAMLVSPHFLFRIERDPDPTDPSRVHRISDVELASRLSYFLWSSMPDEELLGLAEAGKLRAPGLLDAQVTRMLGDPRSAAFAEHFAGQWLETRNLDSVRPDPQRFPDWGPELREAMKTETRMFFETLLRENRPLAEFLDARFTFLNERLAKHYGIEGVTGPEFRRVELATDQRGGILGHGSVLTVTSYPTRTSPVIRGKYLLQNILGAPPPAPPPDVPPLDEEAIGAKASLRQQLEQHRSNAVCASCHNRMDVLGFGLENYDAIGRWRVMDGKFPVDVSGTLPNGKSFSSPAEMRALLKDQLPDFSSCLIEKMLTYSLGRGLEPYDRRTVEAIDRKLEASGYRFQTLVREIVHSLPFQSRRGEKPKEVARR